MKFIIFDYNICQELVDVCLRLERFTTSCSVIVDYSCLLVPPRYLWLNYKFFLLALTSTTICKERLANAKIKNHNNIHKNPI